MKRLLIAATLAGLLAASCGEEGGSLGPAPEESEPAEAPSRPSPTQTSAPEPGGDAVTVEAWFGGADGLFVTRRTLEATPRVGAAAVEAMLEGPSREEREAGVLSAIPRGSELRELTIEDGVATADLSAAFEDAGGTYGETLRLAQLVFTLTQFETVDGVALEIEGEPVERFGGHGIVLDGPLKRGEFRDLLPGILVESPGIGESVSSPVTISGNADVFEATVSISIFDAGGNEIVRTFTTASCGSGCRGFYSKAVRFEVDETQRGVIEVYEASAEDGSKQKVVEIPVILGA